MSKQTHSFVVTRGPRVFKVSVTVDPQQLAENLVMRAFNNIAWRTQLAFGAGEVQIDEVRENRPGALTVTRDERAHDVRPIRVDGFGRLR
jgi:hypothetical protein